MIGYKPPMSPIIKETGSPVTSPSHASRKDYGRSRVTNGSASLPGVDGRSATARRYRDLIEALMSEQPHPVSEAVKLQVRAAASMQVHVEDLTARMARGEQVPAEEMTRAANGAIRALASLSRRLPARKRPSGAAVASYLQNRPDLRSDAHRPGDSAARVAEAAQ